MNKTVVQASSPIWKNSIAISFLEHAHIISQHMTVFPLLMNKRQQTMGMVSFSILHYDGSWFQKSWGVCLVIPLKGKEWFTFWRGGGGRSMSFKSDPVASFSLGLFIQNHSLLTKHCYYRIKSSYGLGAPRGCWLLLLAGFWRDIIVTITLSDILNTK